MNPLLAGLDKRNVEPLRIKDDQVFDTAINAVAAALDEAYTSCETLDSVAHILKSDGKLSDIGRVEKFDEQSPKLRDKALVKIDTARELVEQRLNNTQRKMSAPAPIDESDTTGIRRQQALVSAINKMTDEQRAALHPDDDEVASAVLSNHPIALGMSKVQHDMFRVRWQRKHFPGVFLQVENLGRVLGHLDRARPFVESYGSKVRKTLETRPTFAYDSRGRRVGLGANGGQKDQSRQRHLLV
jgi:hypothetical protein